MTFIFNVPDAVPRVSMPPFLADTLSRSADASLQA